MNDSFVKMQAKADEDEANGFNMDKDMTINTVQVRLIDLGWLYADKKVFLDFVAVL